MCEPAERATARS